MDLFMNMPRKGFSLFRRVPAQLQEGFEILGNSAVENRLLGLMPDVERRDHDPTQRKRRARGACWGKFRFEFWPCYVA